MVRSAPGDGHLILETNLFTKGMKSRWMISWIFGISLCITASSGFSIVNDAQCDCYETDPTHYFTNHKFFDFRQMANIGPVPGVIADPLENRFAPATNEYFNSPEWADFWTIETWNNSLAIANKKTSATYMKVNTRNNIYFEKNPEDPGSGTYMTMRTHRHDNFQSSAEFETMSADYQYLSVRMWAKTQGAPGAVTAMFTYRAPEGEHLVQESDMEILTHDPSSAVTFSNQPASNSKGPKPEAHLNISLANFDWHNWHYYRMDWNPEKTDWYINGESVSSLSFQTPHDPSQIIFNVWSDGGRWSGNMDVGAEAYMNIQWIEVVYNKTGPARRSPCANTCSIDRTVGQGTAVLMSGQPLPENQPTHQSMPDQVVTSGARRLRV